MLREKENSKKRAKVGIPTQVRNDDRRKREKHSSDVCGESKKQCRGSTLTKSFPYFSLKA